MLGWGIICVGVSAALQSQFCHAWWALGIFTRSACLPAGFFDSACRGTGNGFFFFNVPLLAGGTSGMLTAYLLFTVHGPWESGRRNTLPPPHFGHGLLPILEKFLPWLLFSFYIYCFLHGSFCRVHLFGKGASSSLTPFTGLAGVGHPPPKPHVSSKVSCVPVSFRNGPSLAFV